MRKILLTSLIVSAIGLTAYAQNNEIVKKRQETMGSFGQSMKELTPMVKGEAEFDQAVAMNALTVINVGAQDLPTLFPEDSKTGTGVEKNGVPKETEVAPAVWENPSGFDQMVQKFIDDTSNAVASNPMSNEDVAKAVQMFAGDCKECHEDFRIDKD